ncbi:MAG TPA: DUF1761 domain-containing protein [Patescibacteria group bacterium]|nr:DUF1761 domain-containing protein [Patescibacteria group bacterium]
MSVEVNHVVVLVGAVASLIVGAAWYVAFGKLLQKIRPLSPAEQQELKRQTKITFGVGFLLTLLMSEVLFHFVVLSQNFTEMGPVQSGVVTAFFVYLGFIMPTQANHIIFGNYGKLPKKLKLFAINTGGQLVSTLAMGLTIGLLR